MEIDGKRWGKLGFLGIWFSGIRCRF